MRTFFFFFKEDDDDDGGGAGFCFLLPLKVSSMNKSAS